MQFCSTGDFEVTYLLLLRPGPLSDQVVTPVWVPYSDEIGLLRYLKGFWTILNSGFPA